MSLSENESLLGKNVSYRDIYAPELLFPIPRKGKREEIGIDEENLPFHGVDIWNAFEVSWLNAKGKPIVSVAEIAVPASSSCLIESKSLKLYFNSLNQTQFSSDTEVEKIIQRDLSEAAGEPVTIKLISLGNFEKEKIGTMEGECLDDLDVEIATYEVDPTLLKCKSNEVCEETLYSDLLNRTASSPDNPTGGVFLFIT
jgi:7-cyano-7-deazaguanine reductase